MTAITPALCVCANDSFGNSFRIYLVETRIKLDLVQYF